MSAEIASDMSSDNDDEAEQPSEKELALWPEEELIRAQHGGFFPERQALCNWVHYTSTHVVTICSQRSMPPQHDCHLSNVHLSKSRVATPLQAGHGGG